MKTNIHDITFPAHFAFLLQGNLPSSSFCCCRLCCWQRPVFLHTPLFPIRLWVHPYTSIWRVN